MPLPPIEQQLNQIANRTIYPHAWTWLIVLFALIGGLLIWSVLGTVSTHISGRGIVLNQSGLFSIQTPLPGVLKKLFVKSGDEITKGTLIAEIYDAQKDNLLKTTQIQIDALTKEVRHLQHQIEVETQASKKALQLELESLKYTVQLLHKQLVFLEKEYKKKQELYHDELIIIGIVQEAEQQIHAIQIALAEKQSEISDIQAKLKKSYRTEELKNKELALFKAQQEALVIQTSLQQNQIYSLYTGKVLEILVNEGEMVKEEQPLIYAEFLNPEEKFVFYAYFPSEFGKYIHEGSTMEMFLSTVNQKEFGGLLSRVTNVSTYTVSEEAIIGQLHNANLARFLTNQQPVTQVMAIPIQDPQDPSGYAWTSKRGPSMTLSTGVTGTVEIAIETIHPIYYLFPRKELKKTAIKNPLIE